jgi:hypothetical protein
MVGIPGTLIPVSVVKNCTPKMKMLSRHLGNDGESIRISRSGLKDRKESLSRVCTSRPAKLRKESGAAHLPVTLTLVLFIS